VKKSSKYSLWEVQSRVYQIQDGGWLLFKKSPYLSNVIYVNDMSILCQFISSMSDVI